MNLKCLFFLFLYLLFVTKIQCSLEIKKTTDRKYEIYDDQTLLAYLRFKFINIAVLIEFEWNTSSGFLAEIVLNDLRMPNNSIVIRAIPQKLSSDVKVLLQDGAGNEQEEECQFYSLINKPKSNKVVIKLAPVMRFLFKNQSINESIIVNHNGQMDLNLYKLDYFGKKKQSTKIQFTYRFVYQQLDPNLKLQTFLQDLDCIKAEEVDRQTLAQSDSFVILAIVLIALIISLITLIIYYILKVRKYTVSQS